MGRKKRLTDEQCEVIRNSSKKAKELAYEFEVSLPTIYNVIGSKQCYSRQTIDDISSNEEVQQPTV